MASATLNRMASENLFSVRSATVTAAIAWLNGIADALDKTGRSYGGHDILASEIAVDTFVYTRRLRPRDPRGGPPVRDWNEESALIDNTLAPLYEQPRDWEERERQRWSRVVQTPRRRLGLRGAPGSGKSFLTQNTTVRMARQAARQLDRREIRLEEVRIPFWTSASALARAVSEDEPARIVVRAAQIALDELNRRVDSAPTEWLIEAAQSSRALIIVDGLDQLEHPHIDSFRRAAARLNSLPGPSIAACRTLHWEERSKWLSCSGLEEVELAPFGLREQRQFGSMFGGGALAGRLSQVLNGNHTLRHACSSPLLLTFVCDLLAKGKDLTGATRVRLYSEIIDLLLSGDWRNLTPPWKGNIWLTGKVRDFLECAAWRIFCAAPEANRFTLHQWGKAGPEPVPGLLSELEQCGVLVPSGTNHIGDYCWSFLHRTLLEFLAARALSRKSEEEWLAEAQMHFWYEPEWIEVLTFLAAHVPNATPVIQALEREPEDVFRSTLQLKVRLAGAARRVDNRQIEEITSEVDVLLARSYAELDYAEQNWLLAMITAFGNERFAEVLFRRLVGTSSDPNPSVRQGVAHALGRLSCDGAFERLLILLRDPDTNVRSAAVFGIGELGKLRSPESLDPLLSMLADPYREKRSVVANALGRLGDARGFEALVALVREDPDSSVRNEAIRAIGRLQDDRVFSTLQALLSHRNLSVIRSAVEAFTAHGDPRAVDLLITLPWGKDRSLRDLIVKALGRLGGDQAGDFLLGMLREWDDSVRPDALIALGQLGDPRALEPMLVSLKDPFTENKAPVIIALGYLGDTRAVDPILDRLEDSRHFNRRAAAEALGLLQDLRAFEPLMKLLRNDAIIRVEVAESLARLGDRRALDSVLSLLHDQEHPPSFGTLKAVRRLSTLHAKVLTAEQRRLLLLGS